MGIMGPPGPNIGGNIIPGPGISGSGGRETGPALERAEDIPGRLGSPGSGGSESCGGSLVGRLCLSRQSFG